jgi:hypothetical protein
MSLEIITLREFIYDSLAASSVVQQYLTAAPGNLRVYPGAAPKDAIFPLIIFAEYVARDLQYNGRKRKGTIPEYIIRVSDLGFITDAMLALDTEIDNVFGMVQQQVKGNYYITMRRLKPFTQVMSEERSGRRIESIGGHYRALMSNVT